MKNFKKIALSAVLSLSLIGGVSYSGVPTVDPGAIGQLQQQLMEAKNQLETANNQLKAFEREVMDTKRRLEGVTGFDADFKLELSKTLDGFIKEIESTAFDNFKAIANFDNLIKGSGLEYQVKDMAVRNENLDKELEALRKKNDEISRLRSKFATAETPQQREEIANSISAEQMQYEIAKRQTEIANEQTQIEAEAKQKARERSALQKMLYGEYAD